MKNSIFTIAITFLITFTFNTEVQAQITDSTTCYDVRYLDFFSLDNTPFEPWSSPQINGLLNTDFSENRSTKGIKTNFLVPAIIWQLKTLHPKCNTETLNKEYINSIIKIYLKIREIDSLELAKKTIEEKINFIRSDFYEQVNDVKTLPYMSPSFDDGPFYGKNVKLPITLPTETIATSFGKLKLYSENGNAIIASFDKTDKLIWCNQLLGFNNEILREIRSAKNNKVETSSVAQVVNLYSGGERLTLFIRNTGEFMYYFHSW